MNLPIIYGLIGYPVKHSLSPLMHNAAFKASEINAEYRLFEIKPEELEDFLLKKDFLLKDVKGDSFYAKDIEGFNITIPHKVKAREILEREFPFNNNAALVQEDLYYVKLSGAINTIKREIDRLRYWNTDAVGFLKSLEEDLNFEAKNKTVLLFGCGGAGRAIIACLSWKNVGVEKIYVYDINPEAISSANKHFSGLKVEPSFLESLNNKLNFISDQNAIPELISDCDLLINASPIGMKENGGSIIDKRLLHKNLSIFDVVYNRETQLIKDAKSLDLPVVNGLGMLLYQGANAFELWTDREAPMDEMRKAINEGVKSL